MKIIASKRSSTPRTLRLSNSAKPNWIPACAGMVILTFQEVSVHLICGSIEVVYVDAPATFYFFLCSCPIYRAF